MKKFLLLLFSFCIIFLIQFVTSESVVSKQKNKYTIVLHGGAGTISKSLPDSVKAGYIKSLKSALQLGKDILAKGGTSLDAVESVVKYLEDDEKFNAGKGAVYTSEGTHELDASIMDGKDLSSGAVTVVKHVKNPIVLARAVMEKTPHILFAGEGADKLAEEFHLETVPNSYFDTEKRYKQWQQYKKEHGEENGTVGCVALDEYGNLAAATSTGGLTNKMPGRVGDSPLINAGTYANNKTCAVSCTGTGELFIKNTVAFNVSALMDYKNYSLEEAVNEMIYKRLKPGDGGLIAIDKDGNYATTFNTEGMFRGVANSDGIFDVKIW
ncbi:MAG: isoaspartyl peptidase/L-asparaginase [Ignavibacteriaceae bacterium]